MKHPPIVCGLVLAVAAGCHHASGPRVDPATLAALQTLHADLRLVGAETTWVTRGAGYELVARARGDLAAVQSQLDHEADLLHKVFPSDTIAPLIVDVRRVAAVGKPYVTAAPIPVTEPGTVVEVVLPDPAVRGGERSPTRNPRSSAGISRAKASISSAG